MGLVARKWKETTAATDEVQRRFLRGRLRAGEHRLLHGRVVVRADLRVGAPDAPASGSGKAIEAG